VTVITVGDPTDDGTGMNLASFANATCGGGASVQSLPQTTPGLLDPSTKGPLLGPTNLGVVGGADYNQDVMGYLMPTYTPVVLSFPTVMMVPRFLITERATGNVIVDVPQSTAPQGGGRDYAIVQVTHDPVSDSVILSGYGIWAEGTQAAGYWFANVFGAAFLTSTQTWFVVQWDDTDTNGSPSAGDTYTVLGSGG